MSKAKPKAKQPVVPEFPHVMETFRHLGSYERNMFKDGEPSCFNNCVRIKKYRITFEEVEESKEVYQKRITRLWETCDNYHHYGPIRKVAEDMGLELVLADFGKKRMKS